jgi:hypothetical protein
MGSQVSSITCVAHSPGRSHFLKCLSKELLGKSLKHGTSLQSSSIVGGDADSKRQRLGTSNKGVFFNSHSIGPSPRPTNSRATGPNRPPLRRSASTHDWLLWSLKGRSLSSPAPANPATLLLSLFSPHNSSFYSSSSRSSRRRLRDSLRLIIAT